MQYDPNYRYTGRGEKHFPLLETLADHFHFAVRLALSGRKLVGSDRKTDSRWARQSNPELRAQGYYFGEIDGSEGLFFIDDEGRGLIVSVVMYANEKYYDYIREYLPAAVASVAH